MTISRIPALPNGAGLPMEESPNPHRQFSRPASGHWGRCARRTLLTIAGQPCRRRRSRPAAQNIEPEVQPKGRTSRISQPLPSYGTQRSWVSLAARRKVTAAPSRNWERHSSLVVPRGRLSRCSPRMLIPLLGGPRSDSIPKARIPQLGLTNRNGPTAPLREACWMSERLQFAASVAAAEDPHTALASLRSLMRGSMTSMVTGLSGSSTTRRASDRQGAPRAAPPRTLVESRRNSLLRSCKKERTSS